MDDPQQEFIQQCLLAHCDIAARDRLRNDAAQTTIDWDRVRQIAAQERLAPLLYDIVRDTGILPAAVERDLRDSYYETARRNLVLWYELRLVLRALAATGIRVVVLKGVALAETVYDNVAQRPMADVDLLVAPTDLERLIEALRALGYAPPPIEMRTGTMAAYENEILLSAAKRADFDIHWSLFDSPFHQHTVPMDWFWATARPLIIDTMESLMLGPEATLLHLCGHVWLHHGGTPLLWMHDVARTIAYDRGPFDWDELVRRARAYHLVLPTQRVLSRVADEWAVPVPEEVLRELAALQPSADELRTFKWLTAERRGVAQRLWTDLRGMPGWRRRLRFAWTLLFPSPRYMRARYDIRHPLLLPWYYVYRWMLGLRSAV